MLVECLEDILSFVERIIQTTGSGSLMHSITAQCVVFFWGGGIASGLDSVISHFDISLHLLIAVTVFWLFVAFRSIVLWLHLVLYAMHL